MCAIKNFDVNKIIAAALLETKLLIDIKFPLFSKCTNFCSLLTCNIVNISCMPIIKQRITINVEIKMIFFIHVAAYKQKNPIIYK